MPACPGRGLRAELEARAPGELLEELRRVDPEADEFIDPRNVRRIIRALEVITRPASRSPTGGPRSRRRSSRWSLGLTFTARSCTRRIDERVDAMFAAGFVEEVKGCWERLSPRLPSMSGIGYREVVRAPGGRDRSGRRRSSGRRRERTGWPGTRTRGSRRVMSGYGGWMLSWLRYRVRDV